MILKSELTSTNRFEVENDVLISKSSDTGIFGKNIGVLLSGVEPKTFPITSSDALPLSYRTLVGAKAIKLGSWDKHPVYC